MCWVPGLSDGQFLSDEEFLSPEDARNASCTCHLTPGSTRRQVFGKGLLAAGGAALGGGLVGRAVLPSGAQAAIGPKTGDRIVMLGVNGGPIFSKTHSEPAIALSLQNASGGGNTIYLIDVGDGVGRQLVAADLGFLDVRHAFVTHHHSDHVSGYPGLALHGWLGTGTQPGFRRLDLWGPNPAGRMPKDLGRMFHPDIDARSGLGLKPLGKLLHGHGYTLPKRGIRKIMEDKNVTVHATRVNHGTDVADSYGYRFTIKRTGRVVVFSGDTAPTKNLIDLAKGAHTLVHEAMYRPGVEILLQGVEESVRSAVGIHIYATHTEVNDIPRIAKEAGVQRLVLCHYTPGFTPLATYEAAARAAAARDGFAGGNRRTQRSRQHRALAKSACPADQRRTRR